MVGTAGVDGTLPSRANGSPKVGDLVRSGWRPYPFRQFILKVHSRCNLACRYCYLYTMADQRWRSRPRLMSRETVRLTAARIAEHTRVHRLPAAEVVLHGGEPLLAGTGHLRYIVTTVREAVDVDVEFSVQSNGVLLDERFLALFDELGIRIGVSLDGDRAAHDRHRRTRSGGSHAQVVRALTALTRPRYRHLFGGLLCTIDLRNDPVRTYDALLRFDPPGIDFLLPHGNWSSPPPGREPGATGTPYADWLIAVFDRWYGAPRRRTRIRLFEEILNVLLGGVSGVEGVGLSPAAMVVVETDGQIEQSDILASAYDGAGQTGLDVARHDFDAALWHPGTVARQIGALGLPTACRPCRWWRVCGGGLYPHRYRDETGFDNPSVFCSDIYRLIGHIRRTLAEDVAALGG